LALKSFNYVEWAAETRQTARKYGTVDETLDMLLNLVVLHCQMGDLEEAEKYRLAVNELMHGYYAAKVGGIVSMPAPGKTKGEITMGDVFQGDNILYDFKMPIKDFNRHMAIFASAGHGKTVLLISIFGQLIRNNINFLAFDFKQDFRHLKRLPIVCLRWNWLRINPFTPPPGVDKPQWMTSVSDAFAHIFGWFHASKNYLLEFINDEYQKSKPDGIVSLQKVKENIENTLDREFERQRMKTVVLNRLSALLTICHDVFDCEEGFPISELLECPLVIEMDGCGTDEANFLITLFLLYIFEYRKARQERGALKHLIVFDEAHRIFYKPAEYKDTQVEIGPSVIDTIPRMIRDYNEGLIFATQEPSKFSSSAMANTDLKLVGYLGYGVDIETMQKTLQINDEDTQLIKRLKIGQFMAHKSGLNEGSPFLMRSRDYRFEKNVTDRELRERMKGFIRQMQPEKPPTIGQAVLVQVPQISEDASKILRHVGQTPFRTISNRYQYLGLHPTQGKKAVEELAVKGLVLLRPIQLSAGRPSIYLEPTKLGKLWLEQKNIDTKIWNDYIGNVGLEHRVYQLLIASGLKEQGYMAIKEHMVGRKRLDVYAEKEGRKIGVEICISPKISIDETINISTVMDEIIFACKDMRVIELMQRQMAGEEAARKFKYILAYKYISDLWKAKRELKQLD